MANIMRIENEDGSLIEADLMTGSVGIKFVHRSWETQYQGDFAIETMDLIGDYVTPEGLWDGITNLEDVLEEAVKFHSDNQQTASRWFCWSQDGETEKRSLIYNYQLITTSKINRYHDGRGRGSWKLAITRDRDFEEKSVDSETETAVSALGGTWDLSSSDLNAGTAHGRIYKLKVKRGLGQEVFQKIWLGIKEDTPTPGNFDPVLELEAGGTAFGTDTAVFAGDAESSGGGGNKAVKCTFATEEGMDYRISRPILSDWRDYVGKYLVLLRTKASATGSEILVRLSTSWLGTVTSPTAPVNQLSEQQIPDASTWQLMELGEIEIPPTSIFYFDEEGHSMTTFSLNIEAERISGSAELHMDCLILIPSSRMAIAQTASKNFNQHDHVFHTNEKLSTEVFLVGESAPYLVVEAANPTVVRWRWPRAGGIIVMAAVQDDKSHLADTADMELEVYRRWQSRIY